MRKKENTHWQRKSMFTPSKKLGLQNGIKNQNTPLYGFDPLAWQSRPMLHCPPDTLQKIYTEPVSEEVREFVIHSRKAASLANEILKAALPMKQLALGTLLNYPEIGLITGVPECPMAVGIFSLFPVFQMV